jgi:hypothetical protein
MDKTLDHAEAVTLLRRNLKVLLFYLARGTETPSQELEKILQEVIFELYSETKKALDERKSHLRLVQEA